MSALARETVREMVQRPRSGEIRDLLGGDECPRCQYGRLSFMPLDANAERVRCDIHGRAMLYCHRWTRRTGLWQVRCKYYCWTALPVYENTRP